MPIRFVASIVGSCLKWLEISGEAPTMSPARTRIVRPGRERAARPSHPPSQAAPPTPGSGRSRWPCRSLILIETSDARVLV
jgi:hypothetical protein